MATGTQTQKTEESEIPRSHRNVDFAEVKGLMKRMGAKSFDPMPPTHHQWQRAKGFPELIRLWSWMCAHTIHWGHRSEYAIDQEGNELHIENAAESLKMDTANAYRAWGRGVNLGLWRNGSYKEGKRRLYLVGHVNLARVEAETAKEEPENVCTDILPSYIVKKIKELDSEARAQFIRRYSALDQAERGAIAEAVAAVRDIFTQEKDNTFEAFGLEKRRIKPKKSTDSDDAAGPAEPAIEPVKNIRPIAEGCKQALLPLIEMYVQTFQNPVQSEPETLYEQSGGPCTAPASLLPQTLPEKSQIMERASGPGGTQGALRKGPVEQKSSHNQQYTPEEATQLSPEEQQAVNLLFLKMREYQNAFPHTQFGYPLVDPENKADVAWARKVLSYVGVADMDGFIYDVGERLGARDRNSLGKLPGTPAGSPEKRYIGLILEWAKDWKRGAPERERRLQEHREAKGRRDEMLRRQQDEADRKAKEQEQLWAKVEQAWSELPAHRQKTLLALAAASLKAEPRYRNITPEVKERESLRYAKKLLRDADFSGGAS